MKYQIEYCPNRDVVKILVDQRLIRGTILCYESFDISKHERQEFKQEAVNPEALIGFCETVSELDGMENHISFGRYEIRLQKSSSMFSWDTILPNILETLKLFIARDGQLEESAPPKQPTEEYLQALRKQGCDI